MALGFACWRKETPATTAGGEEVDQFLGQGWILANLYHLYRSLVRDTGAGLLRQILTTGHGDLWPGRGGGTYLRPLWDAYLARYAITIAWPVSMLLPELTGQPDPGLDHLQQEFAAVCQPSIDQDLSWQAKGQPRHP